LLIRPQFIFSRFLAVFARARTLCCCCFGVSKKIKFFCRGKTEKKQENILDEFSGFYLGGKRAICGWTIWGDKFLCSESETEATII